jgi:hypothetical protein
MRTTAAALATAALAATSIIGPIGLAGAQPIEEAANLSCGTAGPPVCGAIEEVTTLLEPLAPVLALTGPVLSDLGSRITSLGQLGLSGTPVRVADLSGAAQSLIAQLDALPAPAAAPLDATGQADALRAALQRLVDGLAALPGTEVLQDAGEAAAPAPAPTPAPGPAPSKSGAPAPSKGSPSVSSTSSSAPTGFGGSGSRPAGTARSSSGRIPSVPLGSTLHLGSLAMPTFQLTTPAATTKAAERSVDTVVLPAARAAALGDVFADDGHPMAVLAALSALLLAGGLLLAHVRNNRHIIPS